MTEKRERVLYSDKEAQVSDCGLFRYRLARWWNDKPTIRGLPFVMLNPSTADAEFDDPTIRRVVGFARREGYGGACIVNLFAFRATKPSALSKAADPVGPNNAAELEQILRCARRFNVPVVCAWGAHPIAMRAEGPFFEIARRCNVRLVCLGRTRRGAPRHPLYVHGDQHLEDFRAVA